MRSKLMLLVNLLGIGVFLLALFGCRNESDQKGLSVRYEDGLKIIDYQAVDTRYPFDISELQVIKKAREKEGCVYDCLHVFETAKRAAKMFDFRGMDRRKLIELIGPPDSDVAKDEGAGKVEELQFVVLGWDSMYCRQCVFIAGIQDGKVKDMRLLISEE